MIFEKYIKKIYFINFDNFKIIKIVYDFEYIIILSFIYITDLGLYEFLYSNLFDSNDSLIFLSFFYK